MKWYEIIGLIGSIVSVIAALYTVKYSTIVKKTKNEIFNHLKNSRFTGVAEATPHVISQIKKIANKSSIARGTNMVEVIEALNTYYERIFKLKSEIEVESNSNLLTLITLYRQKVDAVTRVPSANQIAIIDLFNELYELTLSIDNEFNKLSKIIVGERK